MAIDKKYDNYVNFLIPTVLVEWCHLAEVDRAFGKDKYGVTIVFEEDNMDLANAMKDAGFNVREKGGKVILEATKKERNGKGELNDPPKVVGADGKTPLDGSIVGNGSRCSIKVSAKKWDVSKTISLYLDELMVIDLVEYNGNSFESATPFA